MKTNFMQYLLSNQKLNSDRVLEVVSTMVADDADETLRIMSYLTGFSDMPEIPEHSDYKEGATLVSYDIVRNKVRFKFIYSQKRKVSEEFADYDNKVFKDCYEIPCEVRGSKGGDTEITLKYWISEDTSLDTWLKHQPKVSQ